MEVKGIEAESQMGAADFTDQCRSRLQVVAKAAVGLEFEGHPQAAAAGLLGELREGNLHTFDGLLRKGCGDVAGDDHRADARLAAEVQAAGEQLPSFLASFSLA